MNELTAALSWQDVGASLVAVGVAIIGIHVVMKGIRLVIRMVVGDATDPMRDKDGREI